MAHHRLQALSDRAAVSKATGTRTGCPPTAIVTNVGKRLSSRDLVRGERDEDLLLRAIEAFHQHAAGLPGASARRVSRLTDHPRTADGVTDPPLLTGDREAIAVPHNGR